MKLTQSIKRFFGSNRTIFVGSAPGRLDVMGGIADYSGSFVLQKPIAERTTIALALRDDGLYRVHSETSSASEIENDVEFHLDQLLDTNTKDPYKKAKTLFANHPEKSWAAYILGCVLILIHEENADVRGADIWVQSNVPIGKGVSSSAALEVSTLSVLCKALKIKLPQNRLPILAQKVENHIAGAPCGLMDQLATYWGRDGQLLPILCRPDQVYDPISIPPNVHFIGVDSGQRHSVGGSSYSDVRAAAFMGYRIITHQLGVKPQDIKKARESHDTSQLPYGGYLTGITPSEFTQKYVDLLPDTMSGADFINKYKSTTDTVVSPQQENSYSIKACTAHPVYEHHRVQEFSLLLELLATHSLSKSKRELCLQQLGELMYQSHESYSRCGLGSPATDDLVQMARDVGHEKGIYGAKITGGGSGGTVCFMCVGNKGKQAVKTIAQHHAQNHKISPVIFSGSSDGAYYTAVNQIKI